ncbi:MAG: 3-dehydroquinate synthase [Clostridiales bacterium]|nr:3-dehydroquinate synthase [Clostridiales bacterium]
MKRMVVQTSRPYDILSERGLLSQAGDLCRRVNSGQKVLLVSDSQVDPLYGGRVARALEEAGYTVARFVFPAGEESKRLSTVSDLYAALAQARLTRPDLLVALGGGVTGDMTGFAAATWLRGIDFVQIPTSLLSMVDSSVGGKTGVDIPEGKNLIGAFWQPRLVLVDPDVLETLPPAFLTDGMGEVIKTACIRDEALFRRLETGRALEPDALEETVWRCIDIKRGVVERDERESGERKLLNFGHTLAHALERHYHYQGLTHGCAVALGMLRITQAAERHGLSAAGTAVRLETVLKQYGLPVDDPAATSLLLEGIAMDKKRTGSDIDLVLLHIIGDAYLHRLPLQELAPFFGK